jgi:hypothetical protein
MQDDEVIGFEDPPAFFGMGFVQDFTRAGPGLRGPSSRKTTLWCDISVSARISLA